MEQKQATITNDVKSLTSDPAGARLPPLQQGPISDLPLEFVRRMQSVAGNRGTGRWLQAKLKIGPVNDVYEQEADQVAERVMRMPAQSMASDRAYAGSPTTLQCSSALIQKKEEEAHPPSGNETDSEHDEEESLQRKCAECSEEDELMQRQTGGSGSPAPSQVEETLRSSGQPLDQATRSFMEPRFGHDFSHVQVHADGQAARSARSVNALAYTVGTHVVFDTRYFAPQTQAGQRLLAHELTHVIQQSSQPSPLAHQAGTSVQRSPSSDLEKIESNLSYGIFDWAITDREAVESLELLKGLPKYQQGLFFANEKYSRRLWEHLPPARIPELSILQAGVSDITPPAAEIAAIQSNLSYGLFDWAVTDREAVSCLEILKTLPIPQLAVAFGSINYDRLLDNIPAGRKQELIDLKKLSDAVNVGKVEARAAVRKTAAQIFGVGPPPTGMTLSEFREYTLQQADWFVEPTLTAPQRDDLWRLLEHAAEGPHMLTGIGDLRLNDLVGVVPADWAPLTRFCAGTYSGAHTIRIFPPLPALADRIELGRTLAGMELVIPPAVLELTVSHLQLVDVRVNARLPILTTYWTDYQPHIEQTFTPAPAARAPEFERVLLFFTAIGAGGLAPLLPLRGASPDERWVRDLHRFPLAMLNKLVTNLADFTGVHRLILVLHTGHDVQGAVQGAANLFSDLVTVFPTNLVLMIEGPTSLAAVTARIPAITATWGQIVGGVRRISQILIAGHGSAQTVRLAGTGAPTVKEGAVSYPEQELKVGDPATNALLHALLSHLDPMTARILYAGCLVGSTAVPQGTPAASIPAALAANQSLGRATEQAAVAEGIPAGRVQAARASVALRAATRLFDPVTGDLAVAYDFDPNAFGQANAYAQSGHEPEGVLRAAVEVGAVNKNTAETLLRTRLAMPAVVGDWYDNMTRLLVHLALPAVVGTGVDLKLVNDLANLARIPFLVLWQFKVTPAHFVNGINPQPFAAQIYAGVAATTFYTAPAANDSGGLRIIVDQGWFALEGAARVPTFLAGLAATGLSASAMENFLDPNVLNLQAATLLPLGGVPTAVQIRLALAWFQRDKANAHVKSFLTALVQHPPNAPAVFNPAVRAEIASAGSSERAVLDDLGFSPAAAAVAPAGAEALPLANLALPDNPALNRILVTGTPHQANVVVALANVRPDPSPFRPAFVALPSPTQVHVVGSVGDWRAVDVNGRLGFIHQSEITPP